MWRVPQIAISLLLVAVAVTGQQQLAAPALPPSTLGNCLVVDTANRQVKSDADGVGTENAFPAQNCSARITCPANQGIFIGFQGIASGTAYFLVQWYRVMLGETLPNYFPSWNAHSETVVNRGFSFDASELIIGYYMMTPEDTDRVGGFTLTWTCFSNCPATDDQMPDNFVATGTSGSYTGTITNSGTSPMVCNKTFTPPTCPAGMRVDYDFVTVPEWINISPTRQDDPGWKFFWLQDPAPGTIGFPNSYNASEQFLQPAPVNVQLRAWYNYNTGSPWTVSYRVDYNCTWVAELPATGMDAGDLVILDKGKGVIISDADGKGPIAFPNRPLYGAWEIVCPYDTNVATTEISATFGRDESRQVLDMAPVLGTNTIWDTQVVLYENIPWGAPIINVTFTSPSNDHDASSIIDNGFTVKYECPVQCALGAPGRVSGPGPLTVKRDWTALQPFADMCRWEVDTQCDEGSMIKVILVKVPIVSETFKVILDYHDAWFKFAWPDRPQGTTLYLENKPFNISGRAFNGTEAGFEIRTECTQIAVCDPTTDVATTVSGSSGNIVSDPDGEGPYPYDISGGACLRQLACSDNLVINVTGNLSSSDVLEIQIEDAETEGFTTWRSFTGTFTSIGLAPSSSTVRVSLTTAAAFKRGMAAQALPLNVRRGTPGGYSLSFVCSTLPPLTTPATPPATTTMTTAGPTPPATTTTATTATTATTTTTPATTPTSPSPTSTTTSPPTPPATTTTATPTPTPPTTRWRATYTVSLTLPLPNLAAADDDGPNVGLIAGAAIGGLIGLILLCLLIMFLVLRARNLTFREAKNRFFTDGTKYTKDFAVRGDDELELMSGQRATNDMLANADLDSKYNLLTHDAPAKPTVNPAFIDHDDI